MRAFMQACVVAAVVAVAVVTYGYWPREPCDCNGCVHVEPESTEAAIQPPYQFGPEGHSGFQDPVSDYQTELQKAIRALEVVESKGNPNAVGDLNRTYRAYGVLQIRQPYLTDVNRLFGNEIREKWGKSRLTTADTKDPDKARWVTEKYLGHYGAVYTRRTGKEPTAVVYARIHNGGPEGWRRASTNTHARKVAKAIERMDI